MNKNKLGEKVRSTSITTVGNVQDNLEVNDTCQSMT